MPYIKTSTNVSISEEKLEIIKNRIGQAINVMGKPESYLMLEFDDNKKMYFRGKCDNGIVFMDVKLFGSINNSEEMTKLLTDIISSELNISSDNIYIAYKEYSSWGNNGFNF